MFSFGPSRAPASVALFDIASASIGGAYARASPEGGATILYSVRIPLPGGAETQLMLRTLDEVARDLRENGAPALRKQTGSGSVSAVYANVSAPWQESSIRVETLAPEKPFVFTEADFARAKKQQELPKGRFRSEELVLATLLNGYETRNPVGKRVKRAEIILLTSSLDEEAAGLVKSAVGNFSASRDVRFSGFASLAYRAVSHAFPHEKEYVALRVGGEATELAFIARGFPAHVTAIQGGVGTFSRAAKKGGAHSFPDGGNIIDREKSAELDEGLKAAQQEWLGALTEGLRSFAATHALPRTLYLLAEPDAREFLKRTIDAPEMRALWLSEEPLAIIPLTEEHVSASVRREEGVPEDLALSFLALAAS